jgi:hypothetical protein
VGSSRGPGARRRLRAAAYPPGSLPKAPSSLGEAVLDAYQEARLKFVEAGVWIGMLAVAAALVVSFGSILWAFVTA